MVKDKGDFVQYDVMIERYKTKMMCVRDPKGKIMKDEEGKSVKERIDEYTGFQLVPTMFQKEGITLFGPVSNNRNQIMKTRSTIYDKYTQKFYVVKHTLKEIEDSLIGPKFEFSGFHLSK